MSISSEMGENEFFGRALLVIEQPDDPRGWDELTQKERLDYMSRAAEMLVEIKGDGSEWSIPHKQRCGNNCRPDRR